MSTQNNKCNKLPVRRNRTDCIHSRARRQSTRKFHWRSNASQFWAITGGSLVGIAPEVNRKKCIHLSIRFWWHDVFPLWTWLRRSQNDLLWCVSTHMKMPRSKIHLMANLANWQFKKNEKHNGNKNEQFFIGLTLERQFLDFNRSRYSRPAPIRGRCSIWFGLVQTNEIWMWDFVYQVHRIHFFHLRTFEATKKHQNWIL